MALLLRVSVGYERDADRVEWVLVDDATRAAGEVAGLLAEPAPLARLIPGFGDPSLDFMVVCHVARFMDQFPVPHELRKRIHRRLRAEAIEIPSPTRTLELRPSGSARPLADEREQQ